MTKCTCAFPCGGTEEKCPTAPTKPLKHFERIHLFFGNVEPFTEKTAPKWLEFGGPKGSVLDNRWFWNDHVMKLEVGQYVDTDFQRITRVK